MDLYAGTGALGIEALSRGARGADFVEVDPRRCRRIADTLDTLGVSERCAVHTGRVERRLASLPGSYGLVFADPPYAAFDADRWQSLMAMLSDGRLLADDAVVVAEHHRDTAPMDAYDGDGRRLTLRTRRRYGDTAISIYDLEAKCEIGVSNG